MSNSVDSMLESEPVAAVNLRRGTSLRITSTSSTEESDLTGVRRSGSLKMSRTNDARDIVARKQAHLASARSSPSSTSSSPSSSSSSSSSSSTSSSDGCAHCSSSNRLSRSARRYTSATASDAPAPEYLARSLLQLGCPAVSMPTPRGGVGSEQPPSSDSDDYSAVQQRQGHAHGGHGQNLDTYAVPKVQVSGPPNADESASIINGSAGSISARSAPSTPLQTAPDTLQVAEQQSISGSQLTVAGASYPQPPRSPSHSTLRCNDRCRFRRIKNDLMMGQTRVEMYSNDPWGIAIVKKTKRTSERNDPNNRLWKSLSKSTPSMAAGDAQTPAKVSRSSSKSSPTSSKARQKKFHRHFSQVAEDERVLNYYSCALVGDILLQGHLYITPNYFAFYSNVFGYVTKLLIPTVSVLKISKEKTARIIPNAVAVVTEEERHVFCSLLSRDSTYKLMKQVWDAAMEPNTTAVDGALPTSDDKLLEPSVLLVDDSEVNAEEDSSISESGKSDLTAASPTVCTDGTPVTLNRPNLTPARLETSVLAKPLTSNESSKGSLLISILQSKTTVMVLVIILALLYVSAAVMMIRIDRLQSIYFNHPLISPERFTEEQLLHYLHVKMNQIRKVRQSLETLSQFVTMSQSGSEGSPITITSNGVMEPEDAPS